MLMVTHTLKTVAGRVNQYQDHYQLFDTREEAQKKVNMLISLHGDSLYSYAISQILEASEPHWTDPEPILTTAEREKDAEANDC